MFQLTGWRGFRLMFMMSVGKNEYCSLSKELQVGKAGEHLVCAELILQGFNAFLADAGQNYDIVVDAEREMIRVQVRASRKPWKNNTYRFSLREGKRSVRFRKVGDTDCYAFIALDTKEIAFVPASLLTKDGHRVVVLVEIKRGNSIGRTFSLFSRFKPEEILLKTAVDAIPLYRTKLAALHSSLPRGEAHFNAKTTSSEVAEIKKLYGTGKMTQTEIARKFRITQSGVWSILHGKTRLNG